MFRKTCTFTLGVWARAGQRKSREKREGVVGCLRHGRARYLVAFLSTSAYVLLGCVIGVQANNAAVINTSGRQRMLSQRTALFAQELVLAQNRAQRKAARDELQRRST